MTQREANGELSCVYSQAKKAVPSLKGMQGKKSGKEKSGVQERTKVKRPTEKVKKHTYSQDLEIACVIYEYPAQFVA